MATSVIYLRVSTKEQATRGNSAEGFSIPAQRDACTKRASTLDATIEAEFVDAGESAKSSDRPALTRMLSYLREHPTTYVIVHKIDRLARNRADDVEINLAIRAAGATLVSVTENIDETPSGALMHGIMSSIAEFYSRNLANEVMKGAKQKAMNGGTPTIAPIGYLNVRETHDGREVRTVRTDADRAPHIQWAFAEYATGDWSLPRLAAALETRGLLQRPTAKRPKRPLPMNKLYKVLQNRYYLGIVTWQGIEYPGRHEALIDLATFERVQRVLESHRQSGERSYRRRHHLAGALYCARCSSKMIYAVSTGKQGNKYAYWLCNGRHNVKNGCDLPYVAADRMEALVESLWRQVQMPITTVQTIRQGLERDFAAFASHAEQEVRRIDTRIADVNRQRRRWADLAMDDAVPLDIAKEEQAKLARQLSQLTMQRQNLTETDADHARTVEDALALIERCGDAYAESSPQNRRELNQAWFERIVVDVEDDAPIVTAADATETVEILSTAQVMTPEEATDQTGIALTTYSTVKGSMIASLVELRGIEPLTYSMRTSRATNCAIAPGGLSTGRVSLYQPSPARSQTRPGR